MLGPELTVLVGMAVGFGVFSNIGTTYERRRARSTKPLLFFGRMSRTTGFLLLAFGISWGIFGIGWLAGVRSAADPWYVAVAALFMLGPGIAAIIRARWVDRRPWADLGLALKPTRWPFLAWVIPVGLALVPLHLLVANALGGMTGSVGFGDVEVSSTRMMFSVRTLLEQAGQEGAAGEVTEAMANVPVGVFFAAIALASVFAAFSVNLPFMLGEELGWRGYLFAELRNNNGWKRIGFTGVVWGLWHAPLIAMGHNYPGAHPVEGIAMMVLFCLVLALLFDWTRVRTRSVWSACVLHGLINGSAGTSGLFQTGAEPLIGGVAGLAGCAAIALIGLVVLLVDGKYRRSLTGFSELPLT